MLISFTLENWMSFSESAKLSLIASRERQHPDRLARINKYPLRLLPVCAIYGGNASGKTNLFKALNFVRNIVSKGTYQDRLIPFKLGADFINQPSRFCIEILVEDTIYELSFTVTKEAILEERLVKIVSSSEHILYERKGNKYEKDVCHTELYKHIDSLIAKGYKIYLSSYESDLPCVLEIEHTSSLSATSNKKVIEKLFCSIDEKEIISAVQGSLF